MEVDQNIKELVEKLKSLGVEDDMEKDIRNNIEDGKSTFDLFYEREYDVGYQGRVKAEFNVGLDQDSHYGITGYQISKLKEIEMDAGVAGVYEADELEDKMRLNNWNTPSHKSWEEVLREGSQKEIDAFKATMEIRDELDFLKATSDQGIELAEQLEAKYILNTPYAAQLENLEFLRKKYEDRITVVVGEGPEFTIDESNKLLNRRGILVPSPVEGESAQWYQRNYEGNMKIIPENECSDIREQIAELPITEVMGQVPIDDIAIVLKKGDVYIASYFENGRKEAVELTANPILNIINTNFPDSFTQNVSEFMESELERNKEWLNSGANMTVADRVELDKTVVKYGFGVDALSQLHKKLEAGESEIEINVAGTISENDFLATLHFNNDTSGKMKFEQYDLNLSATNKWEIPFKQSFRIGEGYDFKLPEAFNLMEDRKVLRDIPGEQGTNNKQWIGLDIHEKDKNGNYGFEVLNPGTREDIKGYLQEYNIPNLKYETVVNRMVDELEMGGILRVIIPVNGQKEDYFISARPSGGLDILNSRGSYVKPESLKIAQDRGLNKGQSGDDELPKRKRRR